MTDAYCTAEISKFMFLSDQHCLLSFKGVIKFRINQDFLIEFSCILNLMSLTNA